MRAIAALILGLFAFGFAPSLSHAQYLRLRAGGGVVPGPTCAVLGYPAGVCAVDTAGTWPARQVWELQFHVGDCPIGPWTVGACASTSFKKVGGAFFTADLNGATGQLTIDSLAPTPGTIAVGQYLLSNFGNAVQITGLVTDLGSGGNSVGSVWQTNISSVTALAGAITTGSGNVIPVNAIPSNISHGLNLYLTAGTKLIGQINTWVNAGAASTITIIQANSANASVGSNDALVLATGNYTAQKFIAGAGAASWDFVNCGQGGTTTYGVLKVYVPTGGNCVLDSYDFRGVELYASGADTTSRLSVTNSLLDDSGNLFGLSASFGIDVLSSIVDGVFIDHNSFISAWNTAQWTPISENATGGSSAASPHTVSNNYFHQISSDSYDGAGDMFVSRNYFDQTGCDAGGHPDDIVEQGGTGTWSNPLYPTFTENLHNYYLCRTGLASASWSAGATSITTATAPDVNGLGVGNRYLWDDTTQHLVGQVSSISGNTINLTAGALSASSGASDRYLVTLGVVASGSWSAGATSIPISTLCPTGLVGIVTSDVVFYIINQTTGALISNSNKFTTPCTDSVSASVFTGLSGTGSTGNIMILIQGHDDAQRFSVTSGVVDYFTSTNNIAVGFVSQPPRPWTLDNGTVSQVQFHDNLVNSNPACHISAGEPITQFNNLDTLTGVATTPC